MRNTVLIPHLYIGSNSRASAPLTTNATPPAMNTLCQSTSRRITGTTSVNGPRWTVLPHHPPAPPLQSLSQRGSPLGARHILWRMTPKLNTAPGLSDPPQSRYPPTTDGRIARQHGGRGKHCKSPRSRFLSPGSDTLPASPPRSNWHAAGTTAFITPPRRARTMTPRPMTARPSQHVPDRGPASHDGAIHNSTVPTRGLRSAGPKKSTQGAASNGNPGKIPRKDTRERNQKKTCSSTTNGG